MAALVPTIATMCYLWPPVVSNAGESAMLAWAIPNPPASASTFGCGSPSCLQFVGLAGSLFQGCNLLSHIGNGRRHSLRTGSGLLDDGTRDFESSWSLMVHTLGANNSGGWISNSSRSKIVGQHEPEINPTLRSSICCARTGNTSSSMPGTELTE